MKKKALQGTGDVGALFQTPRPERLKNGNCSGKSAPRHGKVAHRSRARKDFIDGIVDGERVLIARPRPPREKSIEIQIRVALAAAGVMVMKHHVDQRSPFGRGLGIGVADLICIVPPHGRFLAVEVKRPGYSASDVRDEQTRWLATARRFGAVAGIASSVEEALALLDEARGLP